MRTRFLRRTGAVERFERQQCTLQRVRHWRCDARCLGSLEAMIGGGCRWLCQPNTAACGAGCPPTSKGAQLDPRPSSRFPSLDWVSGVGVARR